LDGPNYLGKTSIFQNDYFNNNFLFTYSYVAYPGGGEKWGGNGVGDDLYSYGFDGAQLWTGINVSKRCGN
jgi:hypothetical protein